jgi:hypothetical protein
VHEGTVGPRTSPPLAAGTELDAIYPQMLTMGLENASGLNNFGMGPRGGIPRGFIDNVRGNSFQAGNRRDFQRMQNTARTATNIMEVLFKEGFTLGTAEADARAKSFAFFGYGTALGNVALIYDSAATPRPGDGVKIPPLMGYAEVMTAALAALDTAQTFAATASSTIPSEWLAANGAVSRADYIRIIRSYKARFRAQVARTPQERAAVAWPLVIADATNGITSDFVLQLNPASGWDYSWLVQHFTTGAAAWHTMTPYIIGMADTTRAYDTWLATPRDARVQFLIQTPDKRFPVGATRAAQIANSPVILPAGQYYRNRPAGEDVAGAAWGNSDYDHYRWRALFNAQRIGPWSTFTKVENDMLAAEGYIRTGNVAAAAALIDVSRVRNNLPPLAGAVTAMGQPVPGGAGCVPRVPDPAAGYIATKCGDVMEAMKWEKRMETAYAGYGIWYLDGRGWGDLPEGTAVHWPVPWQEMDARNLPFYSLGGVGRPGGAAASTTYGFGTGNR